MLYVLFFHKTNKFEGSCFEGLKFQPSRRYPPFLILKPKLNNIGSRSWPPVFFFFQGIQKNKFVTFQSLAPMVDFRLTLESSTRPYFVKQTLANCPGRSLSPQYRLKGHIVFSSFLKKSFFQYFCLLPITPYKENCQI